MTMRPLCGVGAAVCLALALREAPPSLAALRELAAALVRPAVLPFAFAGLDAAQRAGDDAEWFARARQITDLLPGWSDGHAVFAYRLALDARPAAGADPGADALRRLQTALAWLDGARATAGPREVDLLLMTAFLPEVAALQQPALAERLRAGGGAAALTDRYLAEAERLRGSAAIREQRTFLAPKLAAGLLGAGDRAEARAVLAAAVERAASVRDQALATEWQQRLAEVLRWLDGDRTVDLTAVHGDPRFAPLLPYLR
ncbi:MAG: hypothetical protein JNL08_04910 [Planctomycetes bacterium]|nr:hypothetical protein [Planctomycetota bacterium]